MLGVEVLCSGVVGNTPSTDIDGVLRSNWLRPPNDNIGILFVWNADQRPVFQDYWLKPLKFVTLGPEGSLLDILEKCIALERAPSSIEGTIVGILDLLSPVHVELIALLVPRSESVTGVKIVGARASEATFSIHSAKIRSSFPGFLGRGIPPF